IAQSGRCPQPGGRTGGLRRPTRAGEPGRAGFGRGRPGHDLRGPASALTCLGLHGRLHPVDLRRDRPRPPPRPVGPDRSRTADHHSVRRHRDRRSPRLAHRGPGPQPVRRLGPVRRATLRSRGTGALDSGHHPLRWAADRVPPAPRSRLLMTVRIEASRLLPGDGPPLEDAAVVLDGPRIVFAGPATDAPDSPGADTVTVATVMPGMWDSHT